MTSCRVGRTSKKKQEKEAKVSVQEQLWVGIDYFLAALGRGGHGDDFQG